MRVDIDSGDQLLEIDVEVIANGARDMALEQHDQTGAGNGQRNQDRDDTAGDQAQPKRARAHTGGSGTM